MGRTAKRHHGSFFPCPPPTPQGLADFRLIRSHGSPEGSACGPRRRVLARALTHCSLAARSSRAQVLYGAIPSPVARRRRGAPFVAASLVGLAVCALAGMVLLSTRTGTVLEGAGSQSMALTTTFSGDSVAVPPTYLNYEKGTTFSPQAPFENSAMDKSVRTQQLSDGGAVDEREQVDTTAPHETKHIGAVSADETVDGMARPLGDVKHLDCYGRDEDPECQTSVMPLFDKTKGAAQLSTKQADQDIDQYFAQQQKAAMKARTPIRPLMQGTEKLVDAKGTKFGLSDAAARVQANAIFGIKKGKTQQLRANNHLHADKVHYVCEQCTRGCEAAWRCALRV